VIYDCFPFFNELDLLEVRLRETASCVDWFVIAEAPVTFQGNPKPLYFHDNRQRFQNFLHQIRHVVVADMPDRMPDGSPLDQWSREYHQRNSLKRGLGDAAESDLIIISDADEILRQNAIEEAAFRDDFSFFEVDFFNYYLDWRIVEWPVGPWIKPYAAPWRIVRDMPDLSHPRAMDPLGYLGEIGRDVEAGIIRDAGWHFSWLGGPQRMVEKLEAFSHTEPDVVVWRDARLLEQEIRKRRFFYNGAELIRVPVDDSFPALIRANWRAYKSKGLLSPEASSPGKPFTRYLSDFLRRLGSG
jgi:hypothetical protein